ncbi:MAG: sodium:solute symporter family protein [Bacteroidota bacterium]
MNFTTLDWAFIAAFFLLSLLIGLAVSKQSGKSTQDFFLSGRNMPWWLLGVSMVATTFSADTPNLVTGLVREQGVSGNWGWWCMLLTGMLTVFVFARLWRRSMVLTDVEFYELRYSGKMATFLRGFRALYLGLVFNVLVMGAVSLAAVKFGEILLGIPGWQTLLIAGSITVAYSAFGGLKAVIFTDFVQFILAMIGSIWACIYIINLPEVGGLDNLLTHENVMDKISLFPDFSDPDAWIPVLLVPLAVQWWASYYPGAEPGGGGYIAQRMFSAKDETNAVGATLLYNVAHFALRPWPWILIALASLIVFPELTDIQAVFTSLSDSKVGHDVAYPAMLTMLPSGLLGLVAASLMGAFMSTMSTQMNLGASYLVNDFYKRFIKPAASQKELVNAARLATVVSAILGLSLGLLLTDATQAFNYLLLLGAGTGLIYILRWFWWRINATTEVVAMISSLIIASLLTFTENGLENWEKLVLGAVLTTITWVLATYLTPATDENTLINFYQKIKPTGNGWNPVIEKARDKGVNLEASGEKLPLQLLSFITGTIGVYAALFATGFWIYGETTNAMICTALAILCGGLLSRIWGKM